jgi:hypothetical protein
MEITDQSVKRIRAIMQQDKLTRAHVDELIRLGRLAGELPTADGTDSNGAYWTRQTFQDWAAHKALHIRADVAGGTVASGGSLHYRVSYFAPGSARLPKTRQATVESEIVDGIQPRTFCALIASETVTAILDWDSLTIIDEILVGSGGSFAEQVRLLLDHSRCMSDLIGTCRNPQLVGTDWYAQLCTGRTHRAAEVAQQIDDGDATDVSIGYTILERQMAAARSQIKYGGRVFTAGDRSLRLATKWKIFETSIVVFGADDTAKIVRSYPGRKIYRNSAQPARSFFR